MSNRSKARHAQQEARQEKQAKKVIVWIFTALVVLAVAFLAVAMME